MLLLTDLLYQQKDNLKVAIRHGEFSLTYEKWFMESTLVSKRLKSINSQENINVILFFPNSINYAIGYFAILLASKVVIPLGTNSKQAEILSVLRYAEISSVVTSEEYKDYLLSILKQYEYRIDLILVDSDEIVSNNNFLTYMSTTGSIRLGYDENDIAIMLHTSGTMSNPKRVMLSHFNLISNIESNIKSLNLNKDDCVLISMPMHFGYCNTAQFLTHLYLGASMVIMETMFIPKLFLQTVYKEKITNFTCVPTMLLMLLEYRYINNYDVSSLRYICFGGSTMPIDKLKELIHIFPHIRFVQTYGQTEASPRISALIEDNPMHKIGSVGLAIPNVEIEIFDDKGKKQEVNIRGEIVVRGPNVMRGYYKQKEKTKEILRNGWLYTGDIGYKDDDGYLYITGRKTNMIIVGGINIYPEEIEEVLLTHDNIKEVFVYGIEHNLLGEVPVAKIVLKDQKDTLLEIGEYCKKRLVNYKVPKQFIVVDSLQKTYNGKVKRG